MHARTLAALVGILGMAAFPDTLLSQEAAADERLHIAWVGMIDNSEGGGCANFHYKVFPEGSSTPTIHGILYGPSRISAGYEKDYEWEDGQEMEYDAFMIHKWQPGEKSISIQIYESDDDENIRNIPIVGKPITIVRGQRDDPVLDQTIRRNDTMGAGIILEGPLTTMTNQPQWLNKLPQHMARNRKAYFRFVTRRIERSNTYQWVHVGYGDIRHHDAMTSQGGQPSPVTAMRANVGLGAVCPWADQSKCHYKMVSALQVIGGRGPRPGKVYECIAPAGGCTYRWVPFGRGDIRKHDRGNGPAINGAPDPSLCNATTEGKGAVIPDGNPNLVYYKDVTAEEVRDGGGGAPGRVYKCVCEQSK